MKNVVIIGRPNVGKSTLFNRLIGKRRAITDPTPGVTRDPISEKWILNGHAVNLTDSGGVKMDLEGFDELVSKKSLSLLDDADAILFMMDCTEVTPEDQMLIKTLRPYTDKIVLVVNKIDDPTREDLIWNYFSYGYQRIVGISSSHGLGIDALEETIMGMLDLDDDTEDVEDLQAAEHSFVVGYLHLAGVQAGVYGRSRDVDVAQMLDLVDRKSTRLNSSHTTRSRMPSSA